MDVDDHIVQRQPQSGWPTAPTQDPRQPASGDERARHALALVAPTLVAALFAITYVIVSPPSLDLADHLFRAQLFRQEGFGIWNNFWYSGHHLPGYSVLFPAASAALTPQAAGAIAAVLTSALFTPLARRHFGAGAFVGTLLFGAATATDLFTGRLAFAFGALPAMGAVLALDYGWWLPACVLGAVSGLCSPVAALFTALVAAGYAVGALVRHRNVRSALPGAAVGTAAIVPVGLLSVAFPEGGSEPFALPTMAPVLLIALLALAAVPRRRTTLRTGIAVYAAAVIVTFLVPSPVGSNVARMGTLLAAPLAATVLWNRDRRLVALAIVPLLYLGWQASVRDLSTSSNDPSVSTAYYRPLLSFLGRQDGPPFRIEIPFTHFHWEAYVVATHYPIARGWERQLDIHDNPLFYDKGQLTAASYERWLHANAIRFVAAPDARLDYSAKAEMALIDRGLPYLRLVRRTAHWRIYAVRDATPLALGAATLTKLGPDWLTLHARRPGSVLIHIRFTPYWKLTSGSGCVEKAGDYTRVTLSHAGTARLATQFSPNRIGATSPRCN